jgi:hypothetical protein
VLLGVDMVCSVLVAGRCAAWGLMDRPSSVRAI